MTFSGFQDFASYCTAHRALSKQNDSLDLDTAAQQCLVPSPYKHKYLEASWCSFALPAWSLAYLEPWAVHAL